jgi:hypothetical protein
MAQAPKKKTTTKPKAATKAATKAPEATTTVDRKDTLDAGHNPAAGPPIADDATPAADDAKAGDTVQVKVTKAGGHGKIIPLSVNGRPTRIRCGKEVTITKAELEALQNAGAEVEIIS